MRCTSPTTAQSTTRTRPLSPKAADLLQGRAGNLPVWIRCPKNNQTEFYTGLSRAKMYELASAGKIRSVSIREPGQVKGTRLLQSGNAIEPLVGRSREI